MDTLFNIPETLSPRLRWIARNGILTHYSEQCPEARWMAIQPWDEHEGDTVGDIMAAYCRLYDDANEIGYGETEDDAITDLAKKLNLRLWNEQSPASPLENRDNQSNA